MPERDTLENHSEEVQEIMSYIPSRIIRWGLTVIFGVFFILLMGSYLFKSPEIIKAPMVLTTKNPPVALVSKSTGKIERLFATDGAEVAPQEIIALINNPTDYSHLCRLKIELALSDSSTQWDQHVLTTELSDHLNLGELQSSYGPLLKSWNNFKHYIIQNFLPQKIALLNKQIVKQKEYYQTLLRQRDIERKDLSLAERSFLRDSLLYLKKTTSEAENDKAKQQLLSKKSVFLGFEADLKETEASILSLQATQVELQMQHDRELSEYRLALDEARLNLESAIGQWEDKYLVRTPVQGTLTYTSVWSENQVVKSGDLIATVIPLEESFIIAKAVIPPSGFGKVEVGQRVNIKLNGFPYMEYGMLKGIIRSVSLVPDSKGGYIAEIDLSGGMVTSYRENLKFIQQMDGTAEIVTREMRLITRLVNPIRSVFDQGK